MKLLSTTQPVWVVLFGQKMYLDDTIAAIATPIGEGGIGVVRISGKDAVAVAGEMFRPTACMPIAALPTHTAHYGYAQDPVTQEQIDDGVLTVFRGPRSYTGEDCVEISCHGGLVPMRRVLESALRAGARLAEPGEFTKRAFLNGRLDLAQAEAVLDIIRARTDEALRVARRQFEGVLSTRIRMLREDLLGLKARIEACIDFPDDVAEIEHSEIITTIKHVISHVAGLIETADRGRMYREGIQAVIAGRTNVGKSSLLNALLRESRAIVTPIPGTTRDLIEESINIRGIPVRAIDTAGVRHTKDEAEKIGVDLTWQMLEQSDLLLVVLDAEQGLTPEDEELLSGLAGKRLMVVLNKVDLVREAEADGIAEQVGKWLEENISPGVPVKKTAAPKNEGIVELEDGIAETIMAGGLGSAGGAIVSSVRHRQSLEQTRASLDCAIRTARLGRPLDLISVDLSAALDALAEITGETVTEDVLERIFSEFCIGK